MMWPKLKSIQKPFLRIIKSVCKASETVSIFFQYSISKMFEAMHQTQTKFSPKSKLALLLKANGIHTQTWTGFRHFLKPIKLLVKENYCVPKPFHFCFYKQDSWQFHNCTVYHHELFIHLSSFFPPLLSYSCDSTVYLTPSLLH